MNDISETEILKYNKKKRKNDEIILADLLKLLHPNFNNPKINDAISWVLGRKSQKEFNRKDLPISWALHQLTQEVDNEKMRQLVEEFDLNWDMVIARITENNPQILSSTIFNMHPNEVVSKFHRIISQGCLKISYSEGVLLSKLKELKSMSYQVQDPFRVYLLWRNLDPSASWIFFEEIARILNNVKYYEFENVSNSSVSVFLDCSESMNIKWSKGDDPDSVYQPTIFERGLVHSLLTIKSFNIKNKKLHIFDEEIHIQLIDDEFDSLLNKVLSRRFKLHSDISIPLKYLIRNKIKSDLIFIFTDYDYNSKTIDLWNQYRTNVNYSAQLFLIQLAPANDEPLNLPDGYFRIAQWNDRTPQLIANAFNYKKYGTEYGIFQEDI